jgi:hypothetical protein
MNFKRFLLGASLTIAASLVVASPAMAGKPSGAGGGKGGGGSTTASITLDQSDPHLGDWVTFTTSGGSKITVACYQGGVGDMVYSAEQSTGTAFLLGGTNSQWLQNGGEADCYAWLQGALATIPARPVSQWRPR